MGEKSVHGERKQPSERELASVEEAAVPIYGSADLAFGQRRYQASRIRIRFVNAAELVENAAIDQPKIPAVDQEIIVGQFQSFRFILAACSGPMRIW
jgi:hypothetical protein